jgi:hypothetical protein
MLRLLSLASLVMLLLATGTTARAEDAVELRWRFKKGQVLKYRFQDHQERTVAVGTEKLETTIDRDYEWQWKVEDVDARGTATLEHKFTALKLRHVSKDFELEYDSSKTNEAIDDEKKKAIALFDQIRLGTYRVKLTADGRVAEVFGFDKVMDETAAGKAGDLFAVHLRDGAFGWLLQRLVTPLPAKRVEAGAKWTKAAPESIPGFGKLRGETETTLGKQANVGDVACRELTTKGGHSLDLDMTWIDSSLRGTLKAEKISGKAIFDPMAGSVRQGTADVELGGELELTLGNSPLKLTVAYKHRLELEQKP